MAANRKLVDAVTQKIREEIANGVLPWQKTWFSPNNMPGNIVSGKPYRGFNVFATGFQGYSSPWWVSFKQCRDLGGDVSGETSTRIIFFKLLQKDVKTASGGTKKETTGAFMRYSRIFNIEQCKGIDHPRMHEEPAKNPNTPIQEAENIVNRYVDKPSIIEGEPSYNPRTDVISIPDITKFTESEEYYCNLFHEMIHSTGHKKKLDREAITSAKHSTHMYSNEELIAEMGACFLRSHAGIQSIEAIRNSAAYLDGWLKVINASPDILLTAAAAAQKAVDFVMGTTAPAYYTEEPKTNDGYIHQRAQ